MTQDAEPIRYASYLLRLRLIWGDERPNWTASLENTATGHHRSFPNVETLAAFLLAEFGGVRPTDQVGPPRNGSPEADNEHRPPEVD